MNDTGVTTLRELTYRLADREVLRLLMRRTGDGRAVSIRGLADAAGVHHSTIGHLLTGEQETAPGRVAQAIADRIGVDRPVLWVQDGRTARSISRTAVTK
ncbi:helix-turn-helix domain-containing protein [Streptomyces sp. NPDC001780]